MTGRVPSWGRLTRAAVHTDSERPLRKGKARDLSCIEITPPGHPCLAQTVRSRSLCPVTLREAVLSSPRPGTGRSLRGGPAWAGVGQGRLV